MQPQEQQLNMQAVDSQPEHCSIEQKNMNSLKFSPSSVCRPSHPRDEREGEAERLTTLMQRVNEGKAVIRPPHNVQITPPTQLRVCISWVIFRNIYCY